MPLDKVIKNLNQGKVSPCYLLYGEEEYLISEYLNRIIEAIVPEADRDFSLFIFDGENTDADTLMKIIETPSLLGGRKVIIVKNTTIFSSRQNSADIVQKIIANLETNQEKAVKLFITFLKITGFSIDDLRDNGWKKISEEHWREAVEGKETWGEREKWLPLILEIYATTALNLSVEADTEEMEQVLHKTSSSGNCIIFTAQIVDKRKKIFKAVSETGTVIYFGKTRSAALQKDKLIKEAGRLLQKSGKKMSTGAWNKLGRKTGWELRNSMMELEKLIFFVGDRHIIEEADVEKAVGITSEDSVFELTTAMSEKNSSSALAALKRLLDQGEHHLMILTMLSREIRFLLQARILMDAKKLPPYRKGLEFSWFQKNIHPGLSELKAESESTGDSIFSQHPFVIYNAWRHCGSFSAPDLINFLDDLLKIDLAFKSSAAKPQILLENFLINTCA
jgi:DNA polymerase-3 subunit delta